MKTTNLISFKSLQTSKFWLLGITSGLIAIHLTLTWRAEDSSLWGVSALFWLAVGSMLWSKRETLNLESSAIASTLGTILVALVLVKSIFISGYDPFIRVFPVISGLGIALLASGLQGLKQYWQELLILCFIAPSPGLLSLVIDISLLTAKFATAVLWYAGFDVSRQGVYVAVPSGVVEVYSGCSGIETMLQLLGLALVFLVMFPTNKIAKIVVPVVAVSIAFVVNGLRVALLAVLSAPNNKPAFEYWHKGDGSLVFSTIAVLIFGLFCLFLLRQNQSDDESSQIEEL
ncbi:cyanoexosortase A [[Phormidium ambiguum] IAM M-71]|uniref:Cyanoexosortase A n=1 Tax=[Phormidium ambiguum] IAM M-71 TaxID=454136 RepID=A0A1U7IL75_9CYAN|nr:cyanoexosortase A [Phormidium ambiguum]OKH37899.1 cyanoexosortase A [Phormidium ambiguum IAM M-71]